MLSDVLVVQLGSRVPLRYAGRLIADLGAEVVEVVDPTQARSDEHGAQFRHAMTIALGRNKTRVSTPSGDELAELLEQADAVMIDETTQLADDAIPDHLVVVDVSDFGSGGPQSHWRGSDLIDVAYGGGCQQNGDPDRAPLRPPAFVAEHEIGVGAAIVVMLGIIAARRDGRGQRAEVSGVDSWATIQTAIGLLEFIFQGRIAGRAGRRFAGRPYPYGILPTADGEARLICLQGREWKRSLEMMGDPEWGRDPRFADRLVNQAEHADELDDLVGQWLGVRTKDELLAAAIEFKVAWAPVRTVSELTREPQLEHRKFFWDHDGVKVPGFPATFGRIPLQRRSDALTPIEPVESVLAEAKPRARGQSSSASADAPLKGITVIDFGWAWAGGVVGSVLADFGADVIKIESSKRLDPMRMDRPLLGGDDGTEQSSLHHNVNRNKRSIAVDITTPAGAALVGDLASRADILIENLSPGALAGKGLDYASLSARNERLIYLSLAAVGVDGPLTGLRAYAPVLTALSGIDALTGYAGESALGLQHGIGDPNASLHGVLAILAALHERSRSGLGQHVDVSQLEALVSLIGPHVVASQMDVPCEPIGNRDPIAVPHGIYAANGTDEWVAIACQGDEDWSRMRTLIGDPAVDDRFDTIAGRRAHEDELDKLLEDWTSSLDRWEIARRLQDVGVAAAPLLDTADRFSDDHLQARSVYSVVEHPVVGSEFVYSVPWQLQRTPGAVTTAAPLLGEHTDTVLAQHLGMAQEQIDALREQGVLQ